VQRPRVFAAPGQSANSTFDRAIIQSSCHESFASRNHVIEIRLIYLYKIVDKLDTILRVIYLRYKAKIIMAGLCFNCARPVKAIIDLTA
jgi:hypothetical protein